MWIEIGRGLHPFSSRAKMEVQIIVGVKPLEAKIYATSNTTNNEIISLGSNQISPCILHSLIKSVRGLCNYLDFRCLNLFNFFLNEYVERGSNSIHKVNVSFVCEPYTKTEALPCIYNTSSS
jgi:hypothetical protein